MEKIIYESPDLIWKNQFSDAKKLMLQFSLLSSEPKNYIIIKDREDIIAYWEEYKQKE